MKSRERENNRISETKYKKLKIKVYELKVDELVRAIINNKT